MQLAPDFDIAETIKQIVHAIDNLEKIIAGHEARIQALERQRTEPAPKQPPKTTTKT